MSGAAYDPRAGRYVGGAPFGLPPPSPPATGAAELELLVRFEHPPKFLAVKELPGAAFMTRECQAPLYGVSAEELARIRSALEGATAAAAQALLTEPGIRDAVAAFPVPPGGTFVALGDSITDDLQSWAEILRHCLTAVRPGEVTVINAGISGDTTVDALARLYGISELRPDLVIAMLGTNDCQRHGPHEALLVPPEASLANVHEITRWLATAGARVVWLTPPPVDEPALARATGDRPFTLRAADVRRVSDALLASDLTVTDAGSTLPAADLLPDGVHPSLTGQTKIARHTLTTLATRPGDP